MKGEITELRNDMQRVRRQRDLLERQLTKSEVCVGRKQHEICVVV